MIQQAIFAISPKPRGIHLITKEVAQHLPQLPSQGLMHLFIKHTSAGICINENADPDVRKDLERIFDELVPENQPYYVHTSEGPDDMPAHAKSILCGHSITIPIVNGALGLGTWQGIYLCEFRNNGGSRILVATILQ